MLNFLRKFITQFKEYFLLTILVIISLTLLSLNDEPQIKKIRTFALGNFAVLNTIADSFFDIFKNDPSFDELKLENAHLMLELERIRKKGSENQNFRLMLDMIDTSKYILEPADVISKLVNKVQGNFIINKGSNDGILPTMPVVGTKGLIGLITEVSDNFSVVKTIYNSTLNIAVTIQQINVDGILNWNGSRLEIKNIPTTYDVNVGDRIITSNFSTKFPPSIPVGVVVKRESISMGLLHSIEIEPFEDIRSTYNLFVVKVLPSKQINNLEMNLAE